MWYNYRGQISTILESRIPDRSDVIRDNAVSFKIIRRKTDFRFLRTINPPVFDYSAFGIISNSQTIKERIGDGIRIGAFYKIATSIESGIADGRDRISYYYRSQAAAVSESTFADGSDRIGNGKRSQAAAASESRITDRSDRIGNGKRSQAAAAIESRINDRSDGIWYCN